MQKKKKNGKKSGIKEKKIIPTIAHPKITHRLTTQPDLSTPDFHRPTARRSRPTATTTDFSRHFPRESPKQREKQPPEKNFLSQKETQKT